MTAEAYEEGIQEGLRLGLAQKATAVPAYRSESLGKLALALSKAQGSMTFAVKDSVNPHFKNRYADLAACWDAVRDHLAEHELAVVQRTDTSDGMVRVWTEIHHSSGEWISGLVEMKPDRPNPQGIGSCLTYARRYGLSAMVGIAQDDDDGNAASGKDASGQNRDIIEKRDAQKGKGKGKTQETPPRSIAESWPCPPLETKDLDLYGTFALKVRAAERPELPKNVEWPGNMPEWEDFAYRKPWKKPPMDKFRPCELLMAKPGSDEWSLLLDARNKVVDAIRSGQGVSSPAAYIPLWIVGVLQRYETENGAS